MIRHFTSTTYLFFQRKLVLVWHNTLKSWLPPGGHVELNEAPHEAAIREILEETGIKNLEFLFTKPNVNYDSRVKSLPEPYRILEELIEEKHYHLDFIYVAKANEGPRINDSISLFDINKLMLEKNIFPNVQTIGLELFSRLGFKAEKKD